MEGTITFDKELYRPGDTITANFSIHGELHNRLKDVELFIDVQEEIAVRYRTTSHSKNGSHTTTHTARENYTIAGNHIELPVEEAKMGYQLQVQLPPSMPAMVGYDGNDLDIFVTAIAEIKFDVSWASDTHITEPFSIQVPLKGGGEQMSAEMEGLRVSVPNNLFHGGDMIPLYFDVNPDFEEGFRKIRIELETVIEGNAQGYSEREFRNLVLWEGDDLPQMRLDLQMPPNYLPTTSGLGFGISHALKIIFDKRLASDINLVIPISYVPEPRSGEQSMGEPVSRKTGKAMDSSTTGSNFSSGGANESTCENCGNAIPASSKFCPKCGEKK